MKNKCWKICVVTIIAIIIIIVTSITCFLCGVCNHTISLSPDGASCLTNCQTDTSVAVQSERVSELTLVVNGINNILTSTNNIMTLWALVVSILTLLVAVVGLFGYHELKKEINIYKEKIDDCRKSTEEIKNNHDQIKKTQSLSNIYMQRINEWMYENTNNIAQVSASESAKDIKNTAFLNYYLMKLHLCDDKTKIDECISNIKHRGGEDEIEALQLIVDNDMNEYKKEKAIEAIGYIRARLRTQEGKSQNI